MRIRSSGVVAVGVAAGMLVFSSSLATLAQTEQAPTFELDRSWPKQPLQNRWELGYVMAVAVDHRDHVFVLHSTQDNFGQPIKNKEKPNFSLELSGWYDRRKKPGAVAAPPVVEFDPAGNVVRGWGGPGHGHPWTEAGPGSRQFAEHSMNVDPKGNVWIVGGGNLALKFSPEGKFLLQIGERNKNNGSNDPKYLGYPASVAFDGKANEVYIADGYDNKRIIVYDMDTGAFKRLWGRWGKRPEDTYKERFVHDVQVSKDGLVYGVDFNNVLWVFRPDGTHVRNVWTTGRLSAAALSPDPQQYYIYGAGREETPCVSVPGGSCSGDVVVGKVYILRRSDLAELGSFESASQHYLAVDSKGNIYTTGLSMPQKFVPKTMPKR